MVVYKIKLIFIINSHQLELKLVFTLVSSHYYGLVFKK